MVVSKLDPTINYIEFRGLNKEDKNLDVTPFVMYYKEIPLLCALGREKYTYVSKNIMYIPLYVIHNNKVALQIGLFEILASELPNVLDEDTEIDIERLGDPLFYSYVDEDSMNKFKYDDDSDDEVTTSDEDEEGDEDTTSDEDEDDEEDDNEDDEEDEKNQQDDKSERGEEESDDVKKSETVHYEEAIIKELFEEDNSEYDEDETYTKHKQTLIDFKKGDNWIQQYFKNPNYTIIDNEGGGDCLFAVIRDAYKSIGKDISVYQLRSILSKEANEDIFNGYKLMYDMFNEELSKIKKNLNALSKEHNRLKKELKGEKNVTKKKLIINESKKIVSRHKELKDEYLKTNELLNEYRFMEGIETLDDFKEIIKTCKFWGETWAISTLERALNMKLIIFSSEAYQNGDLENVILCGQLNDEILRSKGEFKPKYYIMTEWLGYHYKTIAYKDEKILTYNKIPYGVREKIVEKCLERGEGPFGIIPKFKTLKERIESRVRETIGAPTSTSTSTSTSGSESTTSSGTLSDADAHSSIKSVTHTKSEQELYNPEVVFQFYERSAHRKPGKGSGEKIQEKQQSQFIELSKFDDWRRKLSNGYEREFELDGKRWNSVEHYYQAHKFTENKKMFDMFTLDSGSDISKSYDLAKIAGSNRPIKNGVELREKSIKPLNIDDEMGMKLISKAIRAKFSQHSDLKRALLATRDAGLFVFIRGVEPKEYTLLMELRNELK